MNIFHNAALISNLNSDWEINQESTILKLFFTSLFLVQIGNMFEAKHLPRKEFVKLLQASVSWLLCCQGVILA